MKILIHITPIAKTDDGVFILSYGQENPLELSLTSAIRMKPEERALLEEIFPERWIVKLYYRLADRTSNLCAFSKSFKTREELEKAMTEGLDVLQPENTVIQKALSAFIAQGAIERIK